MTGIAGESLRFDNQHLHVELKDGRVISTPMRWSLELRSATLQQLMDYHFICRGTGIEWKDLDYHLSIESMLAGVQMAKAAQIALLPQAPQFPRE